MIDQPKAAERPLTVADIEGYRKRLSLKQRLRDLDHERDVVLGEIAELDRALAPVESLFQAVLDLEGSRNPPASRYAIPDELPSQSGRPRSGPRGGARTGDNATAHQVMSEIALGLAEKFPQGFEARDVTSTLREDETVSDRIKDGARGYVYIVLRRLVSEGTLAKSGLKYFLPENAPKDEVAPEEIADPEFKIVRKTKEEKIREAIRYYLGRRPNRTAHRAQLAEHLVSLGIMGSEQSPIRALSVYLVRWPEFQPVGEGQYQYTPPGKTGEQAKDDE